ncbi:MAG: hypothetical protein RMM28_11685, partial [Thermoleophilia bacterium]|nr:hypothetical protein [Gaiellaceae bacterium]MDW8339787.1 hypothetical protein [Thermoleophilia bacterium]
GPVAYKGACDGDCFVFDRVPYAHTLAPAASDTVTTAVRMLDSGTNQDACKNLTMTITWSST